MTSVDKANVLDCSRLWREVVTRVAQQYSDVKLNHMYVDSAAMALVARPADFDVVLTENMFGDILSDQAGAVVGSLGMLGSASIGGSVGLYEPVHGSAPDIAGQGIANPVGAILAAAMLLRYSFRIGEGSPASNPPWPTFWVPGLARKIWPEKTNPSSVPAKWAEDCRGDQSVSQPQASGASGLQLLSLPILVIRLAISTHWAAELVASFERSKIPVPQRLLRSEEAEMLSKCANPDCPASFLYLHQGKLFRLA